MTEEHPTIPAPPIKCSYRTPSGAQCKYNASPGCERCEMHGSSIFYRLHWQWLAASAATLARRYRDDWYRTGRLEDRRRALAAQQYAASRAEFARGFKIEDENTNEERLGA